MMCRRNQHHQPTLELHAAGAARIAAVTGRTRFVIGSFMVLIHCGLLRFEDRRVRQPAAKVTAAPIPSGWQVFHESRFTVAVPAAWTTFTGKIAHNSQA